MTHQTLVRKAWLKGLSWAGRRCGPDQGGLASTPIAETRWRCRLGRGGLTNLGKVCRVTHFLDAGFLLFTCPVSQDASPTCGTPFRVGGWVSEGQVESACCNLQCKPQRAGAPKPGVMPVPSLEVSPFNEPLCTSECDHCIRHMSLKPPEARHASADSGHHLVTLA